MRRNIAWNILLFALLPSAVSAQAVVDQAYDPGPAGGYTFNLNNPLAQSFTVGITGALTRADIRAYNYFGGANGPLSVQVYTVNPGAPFPSLGSLLASASLLPSAVPSTSGFVSFDYSAAPPMVTAGQVLALVTSTTGASSYLWEGSSTGLYALGQAHNVSGSSLFNTAAGPTFDFGFRTYVRAIPEASALALAVAAAACGLISQRNRR